ncbi:MAG: FKBP-type peptidyl-prolyl cis-trans isomerase [Propionibacteriaceae bacterium]|jgi:peptidylprolyl isomerase|nr:FKBP-type peptidyl-prolyl cis-trans isomerase [Propionibacteriaceae bacterium]
MFNRWTRVVGLALCAALLGAGAGCTGDGDVTETPTPGDTQIVNPSSSPSATESREAIPVSDNLDAIEVTGGQDEIPTVTFEAPWAIDETRVEVLHEGDGPEVPAGAYVRVNYMGINGRTGETFDTSYGEPAEGEPATASADTAVVFSLAPGQIIPGFQKGLEGQKQGSRVLIAMPGSDGYDSQGGNEAAGIESGDTLLFVVDIVLTSLDAPSGDAVTDLPSDLPEVSEGEITETNAAGEEESITLPVVTFPAGVEEPTELVSQTLIEGTGPAITETDYVEVDYVEYVWGATTPTRRTYGFDHLTGALESTIDGWKEGLLGVPMGSRVLLVVPADLAYPDGYYESGVSIPEGSTMVYVVDVLLATGA